LDQYTLVAFVTVTGDSMEPVTGEVTIGYSALYEGTGTVETSLSVPSGSDRRLSVVGFAFYDSLTLVGFETTSPVVVDATGPDVAVDVTPSAMPSGSVSGKVLRDGSPLGSGMVILVDVATDTALPAIYVQYDPAAGYTSFEAPVVPQGRDIEAFVVDGASGGAYLPAGTFRLDGGTAVWDLGVY
jgi:hypothetical protein